MKQSLAWLKETKEYQQSNERCRIYKPNAKIEQFIKMVGEHTIEESAPYILSTANGVGKTTILVNLLCNFIWGPQNKFFDYPLFKNWPYPKRARYITNPKAVEEIGPFHSEISKWWPKGRFEAVKSGHNYFSQYKANGWVVDVMTYEQDVKEFESATLGLILKDEPCPKVIHNASISRLRLGGIDLTVMTPLTDAGWFFDEVVPRHPGHIIYADIEDACIQHGVRGHLEHKHIENMLSEMDPEEIEARARGRALYLSGLVFKTFYPNVHILKEPVKVPSNATVYQSVDPHTDKPFACIWAFPDSNGDVYIIDEWPNQPFEKMHNCQLTIQDYANIFKDKEAGWNVHKRIIDRHFADVRSAVNKRTLREELRDDVGLDYYASYQAEQEIDTGILRIRNYLQYNTDQPITSINKPKLYINPHCQNVIKGFQRWARDAKNGKVKDEFKDFVDCVRMLLMDDPRVEEATPRRDPKKMWG